MVAGVVEPCVKPLRAIADLDGQTLRCCVVRRFGVVQPAVEQQD